MRVFELATLVHCLTTALNLEYDWFIGCHRWFHFAEFTTNLWLIQCDSALNVLRLTRHINFNTVGNYTLGPPHPPRV